MITNMSLYKLLNINRGKYFYVGLNDNINNPEIPTTETIVYTLSDFGENIINNHHSTDGWHSERCQFIFNYIIRNFKERCISYQTYKTELLNSSFIWRDNYLEKCSLINADLIFTPYANATYSSEGEYHDFVLPIASHYNNNSSDGIPDNDNRHDLTPNAETLFTNVVSVSARRDTPTEFTGSTSYGFGMEFFEDCSKEGLDYQFPDKDLSDAFAELTTNDGINIISTVHLEFSNKLSVGENITIKYTPDEGSWVNTVVGEIISPNHIKVSTSIPLITGAGVYGWKLFTLGETMWGQAQSWAVPIAAGKLKVIKMTTGADWDTVRAAARATAKRNPTGIPEIDNSNWDIYRGFGCIQVQDAIDYINNNNNN